MSGPSGTIGVVVGPARKPVARKTLTLLDGRAGAAGGDDTGIDADAADLVLTLTEQDAAAVRAGELDLSVAFMRGRMKTSGDFGLLLALLPLTSGGSLDPSDLLPAPV